MEAGDHRDGDITAIGGHVQALERRCGQNEMADVKKDDSTVGRKNPSKNAEETSSTCLARLGEVGSRAPEDEKKKVRWLKVAWKKTGEVKEGNKARAVLKRKVRKRLGCDSNAKSGEKVKENVREGG